MCRTAVKSFTFCSSSLAPNKGGGGIIRTEFNIFAENVEVGGLLIV